jgi:hypothetical protein
MSVASTLKVFTVTIPVGAATPTAVIDLEGLVPVAISFGTAPTGPATLLLKGITHDGVTPAQLETDGTTPDPITIAANSLVPLSTEKLLWVRSIRPVANANVSGSNFVFKVHARAV